MKKDTQNNYSHILKYTSLFGGIQGLIILIGVVRNKAMALLLGASGMGFNALLTSMQNFAAQCTNLGISFGAVPRLSEMYEKEEYKKLEYYIQVIRLWSVLAAVLGLLFCVIASPFIDQLSFNWGNHTLHYAMLGGSVAMMTISGGEMAVLKATRQLGALARIQVASAIGGVVLSIPIYYFWNHRGVVPAIVLIALQNMIVTTRYSMSRYPYNIRWKRQMYHDGLDMVKLGIAFVLAAAIGSGSEMLVRSYLNVEGGMDDVGFYNAAYMITITYAGMVFSAMETDFFPRLSGVSHDIGLTNETVNKQMEVSLLMLSPMLVALLTALPALIPLLFSNEFLPIVAMAQVAVLAMYFKVLTLPVAYITLARGHSLAFLFLETAYFVVFVIAVAAGFSKWSIYGTGIAIVVAHVFDYVMINGFAYWKYGYRCTWSIARYASIQLGFGGAAFAVSLWADGWAYWTAEAVLTIASTAYSVNVLRSKTRLWETLKNRFLHNR